LNDPFADDAAETGSVEVSVTNKRGSGFNDPWVVVRGPLADVKAALEDPAYREVVDLASDAANYFATKAPDKPSPSSGGGGGSTPQQSAPGGRTEDCKHGSMTFRSGISQSTGKAYAAFFCPERNRDEQCKPVFL
jgi:hypothetical protein